MEGNETHSPLWRRNHRGYFFCFVGFRALCPGSLSTLPTSGLPRTNQHTTGWSDWLRDGHMKKIWLDNSDWVQKSVKQNILEREICFFHKPPKWEDVLLLLPTTSYYYCSRSMRLKPTLAESGGRNGEKLSPEDTLRSFSPAVLDPAPQAFRFMEAHASLG